MTPRMLLLPLLFLLLPAAAGAGEPPPLVVLGTSRVWLEGDSTLHRYQAQTHELHWTFGSMEGPRADGGVLELLRADALSPVTLEIPVASLKSGEKGLDENLRRALHAEKFPTIVFTVTSVQAAPGGAPELSLALQGKLSVAGVARDLTVHAKASGAGDVVRLTGAQALKMSDFGVVPPVLMLGTIKTADALSIRFDLYARRRVESDPRAAR